MLSVERHYLEGSRELTGWGGVMSFRWGSFPFLLAFCSLLSATAMQLPTLALFWIKARSVWHFFEEKKKKYQQDWPVRSLYRNCLEGERRKYMLWDFIDLIPLYHNPLGAHILGYNTAWTPWIFTFFHLPPPVSMERKPVISIWQIGNRSKGFTEKREGEVLKLEPRV